MNVAAEIVLSDDAFADLLREQADATAADPDPAPERVAARVERTARFANRGTSASGHVVTVDEPRQFGGTGGAPDPAELTLIAVGASLSVTLTVQATLQGVALDDIAVALRGTMDPARFFTPTAAPGGGFTTLEIDLDLRSDASAEQVQAVVDAALLACPMLRAIDVQPVLQLSHKGA